MTEKQFSFFSTKAYGVSTQKNQLIETARLSAGNMCLDGEIRKIIFKYALEA